jgi:hypothetical protein
MASGMFGAIGFFIAYLFISSKRSLPSCLVALRRFARHLRRYEQRRLAASA